ncbi:MAG: metallophosphoesterase [Acidobacteriota bacterium]|nr:metallophosphoesterase [Acidobacteriota bacterium]
MSKKTGIPERLIYQLRISIEKRIGRQLVAPESVKNPSSRVGISHPGRICLDIKDGVVLVGGDGHYWPGPASTAHRAFVKFCKIHKPAVVVMNGDAFDGSGISRHPPIGWESLPTVQEELEAVQERLSEIEKAAFKARKIWTLGNHDGRFETRLATVAPEYGRVHGFHLKDHAPQWETAWACWINDSVVVKHRYKGGVHASHNNTIAAGKSMVTNHLHSAKVTPYNDYNGVRYGVDTGCIADPDGMQFLDYTEDSPKNWRSGFCVLTFKAGELLLPELVLVWDEKTVQFRGELINV